VNYDIFKKKRFYLKKTFFLSPIYQCVALFFDFCIVLGYSF